MPRLLISLLVGAAFAFGGEVTVVVDFEGAHSERSVQEMKREAETILKPSGVRLEWRANSEVGRESYGNLVLVRFKGRCVLQPDPMLYDERGPYAFTYSSDGEVLPFTEVDCGHVIASVQGALWGDDFARRDYLMGRALGRVVAHELVHVLTRSGTHSADGVGQTGLSGKDLVGAPLRLSRADLERLRTRETNQKENRSAN